MIEHSIIMSLAGFIVGWVGNEIYALYKHKKEGRWR